jgi:polyhydroxybutyrate depolymerase
MTTMRGSTASVYPAGVRVPALVVVLTAAVACTGSTHERTRKRIFGGDRLAELHVPATLTPGKQYPLVVVLHGYGVNGLMQSLFLHTSALSDTNRALWIAPNGTENDSGDRYWNTTDGPTDDVAYLGKLVDDIVAEWPVDRGKIFFVGHSNGAAMTYRMALERADLIAGIMALAGYVPKVPARPSRPISVLALHGTADEFVPYSLDPIEQFARLDGCGTTRAPTVTLDLDRNVRGSETHGEAFTGCPRGVTVEQWTLDGSRHVPYIVDDIALRVFDWLVAHAR